MRRKSERTATKKAKASPEKKVEKEKGRRTRTRTRKQSTSSDNDSGDEKSPVREVAAPEAEPVGGSSEPAPEPKPPTTPVKADSPEDGQDQVWQVRTAEGSGDVGEIQKLKICLTRPPSTPERSDRSPRSKRKHSRAASSSDASGVETAAEEKKKSKHRSKRSTRECKDESDKNQDSQGDEGDGEQAQSDVTQSQEATQLNKEAVTDETPMSTTNEEIKTDADENKSKEKTDDSKDSGSQNKSSDADTTVTSPKPEDRDSQAENQDSEVNTSKEKEDKRRMPVDKSEVLEIHTEDSKGDMLDLHPSAAEVEDSGEPAKAGRGEKVSISDEKANDSKQAASTRDDSNKATNKNDVLEGSKNDDRGSSRKRSTKSVKNKSSEENDERRRSRELERTDSTQSQEGSVHNGQAAPIVVSRKRRWGTRSKVTTQKSITISTDVLKDIIPDVKPVEFDEVIEEKKQHRRYEVTEKVERPILPKIVIDNTENVEQHRRELEKDSVNTKETNLSSNRRISIVKENDSVLTRPPSPPRYKQSNILFITNLVRPFTLPQLKNLLQRTGRIAENGFWIDRIKSKCFVKYETEDQAVETRHALHGVTWPVSNPKTLQVDFSTQEAFDNAKLGEDSDNVKTSTIPGTVEDWLREQDLKRERGELEKPWERKAAMREWDVGKNEKDKEKDRLRREERPLDKRRHRTPERSPEPARKFKKKEDEAPAKLLDDLFRKTKTTPCIYWLPLSAETIAVKEEQRRQHMAEHERRMAEYRRTHRRH